jgi:hypothetical protein
VLLLHFPVEHWLDQIKKVYSNTPSSIFSAQTSVELFDLSTTTLSTDFYHTRRHVRLQSLIVFMYMLIIVSMEKTITDAVNAAVTAAIDNTVPVAVNNAVSTAILASVNTSFAAAVDKAVQESEGDGDSHGKKTLSSSSESRSHGRTSDSMFHHMDVSSTHRTAYESYRYRL